MTLGSRRCTKQAVQHRRVKGYRPRDRPEAEVGLSELHIVKPLAVVIYRALSNPLTSQDHFEAEGTKRRNRAN